MLCCFARKRQKRVNVSPDKVEMSDWRNAARLILNVTRDFCWTATVFFPTVCTSSVLLVRLCGVSNKHLIRAGFLAKVWLNKVALLDRAGRVALLPFDSARRFFCGGNLEF